MTLEEKEFDLVQTQQEKQVKKKQVNVVKRTSGEDLKPDWIFEANVTKKPWMS